MTRFRPVLNALLGLLLLVQGVAVAAANGSVVSANAMATAMEVPCHGDPEMSSETSACCDSDCPNMITCALGHIAVASTIAVAVVPAQTPHVSPFTPSPRAAAPPSLFRPPISLHV